MLVHGLRFRDSGLRSRVYGLGLGLRASGIRSGLRVYGIGFKVRA